MDNGSMAPLVAGLLTLVWLAIMAMIARAAWKRLTRPGGGFGGWRRLAERWSTTAPPPAGRLRRQTVRISAVNYKRCVTVAVTEAGLYLRRGGIAGLVGKPALVVPWSEFSAARPVSFYWRPGIEFDVGTPPLACLVVYRELYRDLARHLPAPPPAEAPFSAPPS